MFELSEGEEIMTLGLLFDTIPVCNGRTDKHVAVAKTALCIA